MTNEEKQLLLKDLSARLQYGVMFQYQTGSFNSTGTRDYFPMVGIVQNAVVLDIRHRGLFNLSFEDSQCKPYLRPMSSITEEELESLKQEHLKDEKLYTEAIKGDGSMRGKVITHYAADYCNKHHLDYRGLIEKGLALEAPEGMYDIK